MDNIYRPEQIAQTLTGIKSSLQPLAVAPDDEREKKLRVAVPERLFAWLRDLRLLRHVPLAYLVPDPELLPPESIRFFHVDPTWVDRMIDGALSAGNIGTLDMTFTAGAIASIRRQLDSDLGLSMDGRMTGMLIRSELVVRWPDLRIRAVYEKEAPEGVAPLRQEVLSKAIMIVLFADAPSQVTICEPHVGLRFGFLRDKNVFHIDPRDPAGTPTGANTVNVPVSANGLVGVEGLMDAAKISGSRNLAINLQVLPCVGAFSGATPDSDGCVKDKSFVTRSQASVVVDDINVLRISGGQ